MAAKEEEVRRKSDAILASSVEGDGKIDLYRAALLATANKAFAALFDALPSATVERLFVEHRLLESEQQAGAAARNWLARLFDTNEVLQSVFGKAPLAAARMRGLLAKKNLLQAEGGLVTASEFAEQLGVARQTIHQRLQRGELFSVGEGDRKLPAWQAFKDKTLPGLGEVLAALDENDGMTRLVFFLSPVSLLDGQRPLDFLRSGEPRNLARVIHAAQTYGEHGSL
jgi:hypothetical protein